VTEPTPGKIHVRQDRFLASGDATEEENQTIWYIPLTLLSTDPKTGKTTIDRQIVINEREIDIDVDTTKPWKLNAGTVGVCKSLRFVI
jgi:aminopeptidase 2